MKLLRTFKRPIEECFLHVKVCLKFCLEQSQFSWLVEDRGAIVILHRLKRSKWAGKQGRRPSSLLHGSWDPANERFFKKMCIMCCHGDLWEDRAPQQPRMDQIAWSSDHFVLDFGCCTRDTHLSWKPCICRMHKGRQKRKTWPLRGWMLVVHIKCLSPWKRSGLITSLPWFCTLSYLHDILLQLHFHSSLI